MSSTEKRDALVAALEAGLVVHGGGTPAQRHHGVLNSVNEVIAEELRNAATRLESLAALYGLSGMPGAARDAAIGRAFAAHLEADAAALDGGTKPERRDDLYKDKRRYVIGMLDRVGVPSAADAETVQAMLLDNGMYADCTDVELESFQALRRQIRNEER